MCVLVLCQPYVDSYVANADSWFSRGDPDPKKLADSGASVHPPAADSFVLEPEIEDLRRQVQTLKRQILAALEQARKASERI